MRRDVDPRLTDGELESTLREVAGSLAYPAERDLVPAVRRRIAAQRGPSFWSGLWSPRLAAVPALATIVLLILATLMLQPVGARALEGIRGLVIFRTAATPTPTPRPSATATFPTPTPTGAGVSDSRRVASVEEASREVGFTVLVPAALGTPDEVRVSVTAQVAQAFLVYAPRAGIPASAQTGIGVLVTEVKGSFDFGLLGKLAGPQTKVEQLTVKGSGAVWIEGLHQFFYRAANGTFINDTTRLSGNVLVWNKGDLLVRVEADLPRDDVVRIAASMP